MTTPSTNNRYNIPNLAEFMARRMRNISAQLNSHLIGEIVTFDPEKQTAKVKVNFLKIIRGVNPIGDTGQSSDEVFPYPELVDVPIIIVQGGGGYLTFPIVPGDSCLLLFCDRDMDNWFNAGTTTVPNSNRVHDINDAIAIVGLNNLQNLYIDYDPDKVVLAFPTGEVSVQDKHGEAIWVSGDTKWSLRTTNHSGWLIMDGKTVGNIGSGADYENAYYKELFDVIKFASPNSGSEVFDDGDTVVIPDMRGRGPVGADNMGGVSANVLTAPFAPNRDVLGGNIGEESHLLTGQESGIQAHLHNIPLSPGGGGGSGGPWAQRTDGVPNATENTSTTGDTNAVEEHQNLPPGKIGYFFVKI